MMSSKSTEHKLAVLWLSIEASIKPIDEEIQMNTKTQTKKQLRKQIKELTKELVASDNVLCDTQQSNNTLLVRIDELDSNLVKARRINKERIATLKDKLSKAKASSNPLTSQVGGDHYKTLGAYQPWEVSQAWMTQDEFIGAAKHTVTSYLARERSKGGLEDIRKAYHTLAIMFSLLPRYDTEAANPDSGE